MLLNIFSLLFLSLSAPFVLASPVPEGAIVASNLTAATQLRVIPHDLKVCSFLALSHTLTPETDVLSPRSNVAPWSRKTKRHLTLVPFARRASDTWRSPVVSATSTRVTRDAGVSVARGARASSSARRMWKRTLSSCARRFRRWPGESWRRALPMIRFRARYGIRMRGSRLRFSIAAAEDGGWLFYFLRPFLSYIA